MYLSKILLGGSGLHNPYDIHRSLWLLFPKQAEANRDFLFRVEQFDRTRSLILLQSARKPENAAKERQIIASKEYSLPLRTGQQLRFFIVANPIKTINDELERKNGKGILKKCRVPLIREDEQQAWLERKLANAAALSALVIDPKLPLIFRKDRENRVGKIQAVCFQGILKVENPERMVELVVDGVGPAKAFGCGLLSLARA